MTNQTPSKAELHEIASTICDQLTRAKPGGGFGRLQAMIGATIRTGYSDNRPGVVFTFKGCRQWNWCRISLTEDDTYSVQFGHIKRAAVGTVSGVMAEDLSDLFSLSTGLDLHL